MDLYDESANQLERLYVSYTIERPSMQIVPRDVPVGGQMDAMSSVVYVQQPSSISEVFSGTVFAFTFHVIWVVIFEHSHQSFRFNQVP